MLFLSNKLGSLLFISPTFGRVKNPGAANSFPNDISSIVSIPIDNGSS